MDASTDLNHPPGEFQVVPPVTIIARCVLDLEVVLVVIVIVVLSGGFPGRFFPPARR